MRVAVAYDCLHPWTVGGEERWLRLLAEHLVAAGHEVTYLTRQQWDDDDPPALPGVRVVAVSRREPLYGPDGSRRTGEAVRYGAGLARHLARHRRDYDVLHTCGFPYFHLLGLRAALARTGVPVVVDWPEVWSHDYWRSYVGGPAGRVAELVQRACVRATPVALAFSDRYALRLVQLGLAAPPLRLGGLGPEPVDATPQLRRPALPRVVFAGRHIREKRPVLAVQAVAAARALPGLGGLTAAVLGEGPERPAVLAEVERLGLAEVVDVPGFVPAEQLAAELRGATCLLAPSSREGFGIVVLEAAAAGTPVVLVDGEDNAAVELVTPGVNGEVAPGPTPNAVAAAVARVHAGGDGQRARAAGWWVEQSPRLAAAGTAARVTELYASLLARPVT